MINNQDSLYVAINNIKKGTIIKGADNSVTVLSDIPMGHKIAAYDIKKGDTLIKYGFPIGHATCDIKKGEHIHTHNLDTNLSGTLLYEYKPDPKYINLYKNRNLTFQGYKRKNGDVGIRNELWIVPTVGCVNAIGRRIMDRFLIETVGSSSFGSIPEGIDDVQVMTHPYGCGQEGFDAVNTERALVMVTKHPNCGGVLVLGLGCEDIYIDRFKKLLSDYDADRVMFLETQKVEDEITIGTKMLTELYKKAKLDTRSEVPLSSLRVGLECGGSDGFSGLTGNPLLGEFSDFLVAQGGSSVMTEVAEMFGSETILMARAKDKTVFNKIVDMINGYKEYCFNLGATITGNPSPGNIEGGITTLEEKALGCTQKGGQAKVNGVLEYGTPIVAPGFNLLWAPGSDTAGTTALGLCCQMVIFTTGRGTPYGGFVPTVKVATNTTMFNKKKNWSDFNAGILVEENSSMDNVVDEFIKMIIDIVSGKLTCAEKNGSKEFVIWKNGISE